MRVTTPDCIDQFDADDSGAQAHEVEAPSDTYEEFEIAMLRLVSGPQYVPTGDVPPLSEARCG